MTDNESQVPAYPERHNAGSPVGGKPIPKRTEFPIAWPDNTFDLDQYLEKRKTP